MIMSFSLPYLSVCSLAGHLWFHDGILFPHIKLGGVLGSLWGTKVGGHCQWTGRETGFEHQMGRLDERGNEGIGEKTLEASAK